MLTLLADIAPLVLAAAANPAIVTLVVLTLTASDRPLARSIAFVAGFAIVLIAISVAGLAFFSESKETFGPGGSLFAWLDIGFGVLLLAGAAITWARRDQSAGADRLIGSVGPLAFIGIGAGFMITDTSALIAYAPALREIAIAPVSGAERAIALTLADLVIIAPIAAPVAIVLAAPNRSRRVLDAIRRFLDRYGYLIAIAVFGGLGGLLLVRGLIRL